MIDGWAYPEALEKELSADGLEPRELVSPSVRERHLTTLDEWLLPPLRKERRSGAELRALIAEDPALHPIDDHLLWRWVTYSQKRRLIEPAEPGERASWQTQWDITDEGRSQVHAASRGPAVLGPPGRVATFAFALLGAIGVIAAVISRDVAITILLMLGFAAAGVVFSAILAPAVSRRAKQLLPPDVRAFEAAVQRAREETGVERWWRGPAQP